MTMMIFKTTTLFGLLLCAASVLLNAKTMSKEAGTEKALFGRNCAQCHNGKTPKALAKAALGAMPLPSICSKRWGA